MRIMAGVGSKVGTSQKIGGPPYWDSGKENGNCHMINGVYIYIYRGNIGNILG